MMPESSGKASILAALCMESVQNSTLRMKITFQKTD
jgi:hypothetical protein